MNGEPASAPGAADTSGSPTGPTSVYLWGADREGVNRTAQMLAQRLGPTVAWVGASGPDPATARAGAVADGDHPPSELVPIPRISDRLLGRYLRPRGQRPDVNELAEFLRLPEPVQAAVARLRDGSGPRVLVVANADRLRPFDLEGRGLYGPFVPFLNRLGVTLVLTSVSRSLPERARFQYSITLGSSLPEGFRVGAAVCVWGECSSCFVARRFDPREVVCLSRLAERLPPSEAGSARSPGVAAH